MAPSKIIIDTDPGIDDVLALLLALASPDELDLLLISLTHGNVDVRGCLHNAVTMFHVLDREREWRRAHNRDEGFGGLRKHLPLLAVGAAGPFLKDQKVVADYFHGMDGVGNVHSTHPHFTPTAPYAHAFGIAEDGGPAVLADAEPTAETTIPEHPSFRPSRVAAHEEILRLLRENEPDTVTIVAVGPLTNLAKAVAIDPDAFMRVKEVVIMGGTVDMHGNVTPVSEFNFYADPFAAATVLAYTAIDPLTTLPPTVTSETTLRPPSTPSRLTVRLFPLDTTEKHVVTRGRFRDAVTPAITAGSPLAGWLNALMAHTFATMERLHVGHVGDTAALALHDPVCVWYAATANKAAEAEAAGAGVETMWRWRWPVRERLDVRVEPLGQWTRGMCVVDRRRRRGVNVDGGGGGVGADHGGWLSGRGNRVVMVEVPAGAVTFGDELLRRVFG